MESCKLAICTPVVVHATEHAQYNSVLIMNTEGISVENKLQANIADTDRD